MKSAVAAALHLTLPLALATTTVAVPRTAGAQDQAKPDSAASESKATRRQAERIIFTTSAAASSTPTGWLGRTPGRGLFLTTIRSTWRASGSESASIGYFAELVPLAVVTRNPVRVRPLEQCVRDHPEWRTRETIPAVEYFENCATHSASAYGAGVTPLGLSTRFTRSSGMAIVTEASVSAIMFDKTMPYPTTTRLNFNIGAGTSLEFPLRGRSVMSVGYYMYHLSNGGQEEFNPGVFAHALQVGWGRRR